MNPPEPVLSQLMQVILDRQRHPSPDSYTSSLLSEGSGKIGQKIVEEAAEVVDAASEGEAEAARQHLVREAADLVYHLLVMLAYRGTELADVEAELRRRFGISGIEEKASRRAP